MTTSSSSITPKRTRNKNKISTTGSSLIKGRDERKKNHKKGRQTEETSDLDDGRTLAAVTIRRRTRTRTSDPRKKVDNLLQQQEEDVQQHELQLHQLDVLVPETLLDEEDSAVKEKQGRGYRNESYNNNNNNNNNDQAALAHIWTPPTVPATSHPAVLRILSDLGISITSADNHNSNYDVVAAQCNSSKQKRVKRARRRRGGGRQNNPNKQTATSILNDSDSGGETNVMKKLAVITATASQDDEDQKEVKDDDCIDGTVDAKNKIRALERSTKEMAHCNDTTTSLAITEDDDGANKESRSYEWWKPNKLPS